MASPAIIPVGPDSEGGGSGESTPPAATTPAANSTTDTMRASIQTALETYKKAEAARHYPTPASAAQTQVAEGTADKVIKDVHRLSTPSWVLPVGIGVVGLLIFLKLRN